MTPSLWFSCLLGLLAVAFIVWGILRPTAHCRGCASSGHEVSRLRSIVASLEVAVGNWITRAQNAEAKCWMYEQREAEAKARDERIWQGVLSTVAEVKRQQEWREYRATKGIDHHTRHFAEGAIDSEWATEVMQLCVGGLEVDRDDNREEIQ